MHILSSMFCCLQRYAWKHDLPDSIIYFTKDRKKGQDVESQKYEPMFNLAIQTGSVERRQSETLDLGFDTVFETWEIVVRYVGKIDFLREYGVEIVYLEGNYAILTVPEAMIERLSSFPEIIYVEMPKQLYFTVTNGIRTSCINAVKAAGFAGGGLSGRGVICALIDSGIDIFQPVFRKEDGTTRLLEIWDQSIGGNPPEGYRIGSVYDREQINALLREYDPENNGQNVFNEGIIFPADSLIPARDISGHGTHVAGIMAGNFAEDKNNSLGIATDSDLLVVKLNNAVQGGVPRTTELMQALDYVYKAAVRYGMPTAVNISLGNSYGSHDGTSLLETYIDHISNLWKMSICIGAGNEGSSAGHSETVFESGETKRISFSVGEYERNLDLQIWKTYEDEFQMTIYAPGVFEGVKLNAVPGVVNTRLGSNRLMAYCGEPSPYSRFQEIYVELIPFPVSSPFVTSGIWTIQVTAGKVVSGRLDMWLPTSAALSDNTRFIDPSPDTTLTIPSTSTKAISVGGYNAVDFSYADFSGRGYTRLTDQIKPDLLAPAVNIVSAAVGGGLAIRSGTSMACPFVTGSAALLMEWGIVNGNDPYLYGEKLKSFLLKGARGLSGEPVPSVRQGFGTLCVRNAFPI